MFHQHLWLLPVLLAALIVPVKGWIVSSPTASPRWTRQAKINDDDSGYDDDLLETVSDAEALLACRAHLQRANRLGQWTEGENRKQQRRSAMQQAKQSDTVGFFWENPDELIYYDRTKRPQFLTNETITEDNDDDAGGVDRALPSGTDGDFWENPDELISHDRTKMPLESLTESDSDEADDTPREESLMEPESSSAFDDTFTSTDTFTLTTEFDDSFVSDQMNSLEFSPLLLDDDPIEDDDLLTADTVDDSHDEAAYFAHKQRSASAKRKFDDPDWKDYWYERRWMGHDFKSEAQKKQQSLDVRVRSEAMKDVLSHPELCKLDEEIIAKAIQMYRSSNDKRSVNVRKAKQEGKVPIVEHTNEKLPRDILYRIDEEELATKRRQRSERAEQLYKKRLENKPRQNRGRRRKKAKKRSLQNIDQLLAVETATPSEALERINALLDIDPFSVTTNSTVLNVVDHDLGLVSKPLMLSGRKFLLRRMLNDLFGLRGKCVPTKNGLTTFVTTGSIPDLSRFVKLKLDNRRAELEKP